MIQHDQTWDLLESALNKIEYRREPPPGERFRFHREDESNYSVLFIFTYNENTYRPGEMRHTRHEFVVPVATYNERQWTRWVTERLLSIEMHETVENLFVDGERINSPYHGDGWDPYALWFEGDLAERAKAPGEQ